VLSEYEIAEGRRMFLETALILFRRQEEAKKDKISRPQDNNDDRLGPQHPGSQADGIRPFLRNVVDPPLFLKIPEDKDHSTIGFFSPVDDVGARISFKADRGRPVGGEEQSQTEEAAEKKTDPPGTTPFGSPLF